MVLDINGFNMTATKKPAIPTGSGRAFRIPSSPTHPTTPSQIGGSNSQYGVQPSMPSSRPTPQSMGYQPEIGSFGGASQIISTPQNFKQNFFGNSNYTPMTEHQLWDYNPLAVMQSAVAGMREMHPELQGVKVMMGEGMSFMPAYRHGSGGSDRLVTLPEPMQFQELVASKMINEPDFVSRMSRITNTPAHMLTPERVMQGIVAHELGHGVDNWALQQSGQLAASYKLDKQQRAMAQAGSMRYEDIASEVRADDIANSSLGYLNANFDMGLDRSTAQQLENDGSIIQYGTVRDILGRNDAAAMGFFGETGANGRTGMLRFLNDTGGGGRGNGMTINNAPGSIGGNQYNSSIQGQDIASDKLKSLVGFAQQGGADNFRQMIAQAKGGFKSVQQARNFNKAYSQYVKARGAIGRFDNLQATPGGLEGAYPNMGEVGDILSSGDARDIVGGFDKKEIDALGGQAENYLVSHTGQRGPVKGSRSSGGVSEVASDMKELSKSIKEVTEGNKKQAASTKEVIDSNKGANPLNNPNLNMSQEERQGRLLQAISSGGIGGQRARAAALKNGLYGSGGGEGDNGGLNLWGMHFGSEGGINAAGALIRMGNRASSALHAMTHISHNVINPIAQEVSNAETQRISTAQMIFNAGGASQSDVMGSLGSVYDRRGAMALARQSASQGVYNTYAGLASMFGGQQSGVLQGAIQSSVAPALSAAVGLQAIGGATLAGPAALGIAAIGGAAWLAGQAGDYNQVGQSVYQTWKNPSDPRNALNNLIAGTSALFNPDAAAKGAKYAGAMQGFEEMRRGYSETSTPANRPMSVAEWLLNGQPGGNYEQYTNAKNVTRTASKYAGMSFQEYTTSYARDNNTSQYIASQGAYQDYIQNEGKGLLNGDDQTLARQAFGQAAAYGGTGGGFDSLLTDLTQASLVGDTQKWSRIQKQVSATGGSILNPNAVRAGQVNDTFGLAKWLAKGKSLQSYNDLTDMNSKWVGAANLLNRQTYGAGKRGLIYADDERYVNQPWLMDIDTEARKGGLSARMSNVAAFDAGYGAMSENTRMGFGEDIVGRGVFEANEQIGLGLDRRMRGRGMGSVRSSTLNRISNLSQAGGDIFNNLMNNDAWTTSVINKRAGGDAGLVTIDTATGLRSGQYSMNADYFAALQKNDKLGLLKGMSVSDVAGGTMGIQRNMELQQRQFQMFQYGQAQQQQSLQYGMTIGGGTLNNQGFVQGGSLAGVAQIYAQHGMTFNAGNGMNQWQVQDASTQLQRQQTLFSLGQAGQQMQMQVAQFNTSGQQWQENRALQVAQFNYNTAFTRQQMGIDRSHQVTQEGWQKADLQFNRNMSELQFGFTMRDADRNIRYARGRDRLDLMRQRDDAVILHAAQMGQQDKEEDRQKTREKWSEDQYKRDKEHFDKTTEFQKQQMDLDKKHYEQNRSFELQSIQMSQAAHNMNVQMTIAQMKLDDQSRLLERQGTLLQMNMSQEALVKQQQLTVYMQQNQDKLNGIAQAQAVIDAQHYANLQTEQGLVQALNQAIQAAYNYYSYNYSGPSGTGSNNPAGGGLSSGGYVLPGFADGGFTGYGDMKAARGVVHGGEYVIPQNGTPVIRGDNPQHLEALNRIASILERIEKNPAIVNAVINTNQQNVSMRNLNLTDIAHGTIH